MLEGRAENSRVRVVHSFVPPPSSPSPREVCDNDMVVAGDHNVARFKVPVRDVIPVDFLHRPKELVGYETFLDVG